MARAEAVDVDETAEMIAGAGDAMILLIPRSMWETLLLQGRADGLQPAQVLDRAVREYLEKHGSEEVVRYLRKVHDGRGA